MNDKLLRRKIAKLAYDKPELRPHLIPLLKSAALPRNVVEAMNVLIDFVEHTYFLKVIKKERSPDFRDAFEIRGWSKTKMPLRAVFIPERDRFISVEVWSGFPSNPPTFDILVDTVHLKVAEILQSGPSVPVLNRSFQLGEKVWSTRESPAELRIKNLAPLLRDALYSQAKMESMDADSSVILGISKSGKPLKIKLEPWDDTKSVGVEIWTGFFDRHGPNYGNLGADLELELRMDTRKMVSLIENAARKAMDEKGFAEGDASWMRSKKKDARNVYSTRKLS